MSAVPLTKSMWPSQTGQRSKFRSPAFLEAVSYSHACVSVCVWLRLAICPPTETIPTSQELPGNQTAQLNT